MKIQHLLPLLLGLVVLSGCKKEEDEPQELDIFPARDMALIDGAYNDAFSMVDRVGRSEPGLRDNYGLPECATVIFQDTLQFPFTVIIDFGETNCTDDWGINRRGEIIVTISGPYAEEGTTIETNLDDYYVMDHHLQGTRVVTNLGENSAGNPEFSVEESDVSLTAPDDSWTSYWESNRTREWIEGHGGISAWLPFDDVYAVTGDASGVSRNGTPYTINVTSPLIWRIGCPWVYQGSLDLLPENGDVLSLFYGGPDDTCDDQAVVTVFGNEYNISLQ